jgi:hypothetical protein
VLTYIKGGDPHPVTTPSAQLAQSSSVAFRDFAVLPFEQSTSHSRGVELVGQYQLPKHLKVAVAEASEARKGVMMTGAATIPKPHSFSNLRRISIYSPIILMMTYLIIILKGRFINLLLLDVNFKQNIHSWRPPPEKSPGVVWNIRL